MFILLFQIYLLFETFTYACIFIILTPTPLQKPPRNPQSSPCPNFMLFLHSPLNQSVLFLCAFMYAIHMCLCPYVPLCRISTCLYVLMCIHVGYSHGPLPETKSDFFFILEAFNCQNFSPSYGVTAASPQFVLNF